MAALPIGLFSDLGSSLTSSLTCPLLGPANFTFDFSDWPPLAGTGQMAALPIRLSSDLSPSARPRFLTCHLCSDFARWGQMRWLHLLLGWIDY
jgi:hypothetical protein